jgi:hypothetical protein
MFWANMVRKEAGYQGVEHSVARRSTAPDWRASQLEAL